jgi:hypothetical protein
VVGLVDVADGHGGDSNLIADPVRERRLKHAPIDGSRIDGGLTSRHVDDVNACGTQQTRDGDGVGCGGAAVLITVMPSRATQSLAEMRTEIGFCEGHTTRTTWSTSIGKRMRFSRLVQRHATLTPKRRAILTPLSREPISC